MRFTSLGLGKVYALEEGMPLWPCVSDSSLNKVGECVLPQLPNVLCIQSWGICVMLTPLLVEKGWKKEVINMVELDLDSSRKVCCLSHRTSYVER